MIKPLSLCAISVLLLSAGGLKLEAVAPIPLKAGSSNHALPTSGTTVTFEFKNDTQKDMYGFMLSTQESSGIDPDFEGSDVVIKKGTRDLKWNNSPATGDGVEDIEVTVKGLGTRTQPVKADVIEPGQVFTLTFTSNDGFSSGDILTVTPLTCVSQASGYEAVPLCAFGGIPHSPSHAYRYFNAYEGLPSKLKGLWDGTNGFSVPLENIELNSPSLGVKVDWAMSSHPHVFNPFTGVIVFTPPIQPGASFDYLFGLNATDPFFESDLDPYTLIEATANVAPSFQLSVSGLVGGSVATFEMNNGTPSGWTALAYSLSGGGPVVLLGGPCPGLSVDLNHPINLLGTFPLDGTGSFTLPINVPGGASGISLWLQAVDLSFCSKSNVVHAVIG